MTDPQNDVPCRDCKRPTQHASGICDNCRTPAGRLVTALRERGIKALPPGHAATGDENVRVDGMTVSAHTLGWDIGFNDGSRPRLRLHIEAAANAIAAIVQAPGLRAENATLAAEVKRLRFQRDKAAKWAGVDLSELDTMADEHGFTVPSEVPDAR